MAGAAGSLVGRVCMVTGATGALGKATASEFARRGATVVAVAPDEGPGRAPPATVPHAGGGRTGRPLLAGLSHHPSPRGPVESFLGTPPPARWPVPPPPPC